MAIIKKEIVLAKKEHLEKTDKTNKTERTEYLKGFLQRSYKVAYIIALLCSLTIIQTQISYSEVLVSQIHYDPEGTDEGKEFVDIYNYGSEVISIKNLKILGGSTSLTELWNGNTCIDCYLFPEEGKRILVGTLHNSAGAVLLEENNVTKDLVGYGTATFFSGTPAGKVSSGKSLLRIHSTQNNSYDFISSDVVNLSNDKLYPEIFVQNARPDIINASIYSQGENLFVKANVEDLNGEEDIVLLNYSVLNESKTINFSEDGFSITNEPGATNVSLTVIDKNGLESLPLFVQIIHSLFQIMSLHPVTILPGNTDSMNVEIYAHKEGNYSVSVSNLYGEKEIPLNVSSIQEMSMGSLKNFSLPITIPKGTPSGKYKGMLSVVIE